MNIENFIANGIVAFILICIPLGAFFYYTYDYFKKRGHKDPARSGWILYVVLLTSLMVGLSYLFK